MKKTRITLIQAMFAALPLALALAMASGCESKGPAERAGENIDRGIEEAQDAINPPGPGEKAGRSLDRALNE